LFAPIARKGFASHDGNAKQTSEVEQMRRVVLSLAAVAIVASVAASQQPILTLEDCVRIAWGEQPQVAIAEKSWKLAEERLKSIRANLFPQISAGYQFRRYLSTRIGFQMGVPSSSGSRASGVQRDFAFHIAVDF
jgi:outer membrane protein TolC